MRRIRTIASMRVFFALMLVIGVFGTSTPAILAVLSDHFDHIEWVMDMDMEEEEKESEKEEKKERYVHKNTASLMFIAHSTPFQKDGAFQILSHCEEILTPPPEHGSC